MLKVEKMRKIDQARMRVFFGEEPPMDLLTSSQIVHCFCKWYFTSHLLLEKKNSAFFPTRHRPKMIYKNYYLDESVVVAYFDPTELNGNWPVRRIIIVLSTHLCEKGTQTLKFV